MDTTKLSSLQQAISKDSSVITKFINADDSEKMKLLGEFSNDKGLQITSAEINQIISNPEQLMNGLEISDSDLAAIAGGGKGSADINNTGNIGDGNTFNNQGGTSKNDTSASADVKK